MTVAQYPIGLFVDITPSATTEAINQLIVELNALFLVGAPAPGTAVTQKQLRLWAAANGTPRYIYTLDQAVPADIGNAVNILWSHGGTMVQGDALYNFVLSTLGFTAAQMQSAFSAMGVLAP